MKSSLEKALKAIREELKKPLPPPRIPQSPPKKGRKHGLRYHETKQKEEQLDLPLGEARKKRGPRLIKRAR
jgi:hypothetical protein